MLIFWTPIWIVYWGLLSWISCCEVVTISKFSKFWPLKSSGGKCEISLQFTSICRFGWSFSFESLSRRDGLWVCLILYFWSWISKSTCWSRQMLDPDCSCRDNSKSAATRRGQVPTYTEEAWVTGEISTIELSTNEDSNAKSNLADSPEIDINSCAFLLQSTLFGLSFLRKSAINLMLQQAIAAVMGCFMTLILLYFKKGFKSRLSNKSEFPTKGSVKIREKSFVLTVPGCLKVAAFLCCMLRFWSK